VSHPQFLRELADDANSIGHVRHVDRQLILDSMLLILTQFAGNLIFDCSGTPLRIARNVILVNSRPCCPLWMQPIFQFFNSRKKEEQHDPGFGDAMVSLGLTEMSQPGDDNGYDWIEDIILRAATPWPLRKFLENGFDLFQAPMAKYLITRSNDLSFPRIPQGGAVVLVEGSQHLRALSSAQEQCNALWRLLQETRPEVSMFGWVERNGTEIQNLQFPGTPLLLNAPHGTGMHMDLIIEDHGNVYSRSLYYRMNNYIGKFTEVLGRLLKKREQNQVLEFNPNSKCRELLRRAAADEHRDVMEFPEEYRRLAMPVMGLSQSLSALFWLLEFRPRQAMETLLVTSSAVNIAERIRRRSLSWLRRELASNCSCSPGINSMDVRVLEKLREKGCATSPRELLRSFHRIHRPELDEVLSRLLDAGLVQNHAGKVLAV